MFFKVLRLKRIAAGTSRSELFTRTTFAASSATSVPAPTAIPVSAAVRAGASLIPSPTMQVFPDFLNSFTIFSFPPGRTPAIIWSIPAFLPIATAVFSLSPVRSATFMPIFLSSDTACMLSSFITSETAIIPRNFSSSAKKRGVFPSSESFSACERNSGSTGFPRFFSI